jgi:hypothetical protein
MKKGLGAKKGVIDNIPAVRIVGKYSVNCIESIEQRFGDQLSYLANCGMFDHICRLACMTSPVLLGFISFQPYNATRPIQFNGRLDIVSAERWTNRWMRNSVMCDQYGHIMQVNFYS